MANVKYYSKMPRIKIFKIANRQTKMLNWYKHKSKNPIEASHWVLPSTIRDKRLNPWNHFKFLEV